MAEYPKQHPRSSIVRKAELDLMTFMIGLRKKYDLTASEEFLIFSQSQAQLAASCVNSERRDAQEREESARFILGFSQEN